MYSVWRLYMRNSRSLSCLLVIVVTLVISTLLQSPEILLRSPVKLEVAESNQSDNNESRLNHIAQLPGVQQPIVRHPTVQPLSKVVFDLQQYPFNDLVVEIKRCQLVRPQNFTLRYGVWTISTNEKLNCEVSLYGAYYDARLKAKPVVRLFGVSSCAKPERVTCQLWYEGRRQPVLVSAEIQDTGRGMSFGKTKYQERLYICELLVGALPIPEAVSLVYNECANASSSLSVFNAASNTTAQAGRPRHDFGVCMVVSYGKLKPQRLIEWVEFNRLLGVGEINVYNSSLNAEALEVLTFYSTAEAGLVRIWQSAPPTKGGNWCMWCQKLAAIPVLNDCLYRTMYRYRYTLVIDFDEVIVPRIDRNYKQLFARLEYNLTNDRLPSSIQFRNVHFFLDLEAEPRQMVTYFRHLNRVEPSARGRQPKTAFDPRRCVVAQNHYCVEYVDKQSWSRVLVPEVEVAASHHYKKCGSVKWYDDSCDRLRNATVTRDVNVMRFRTQLVARIAKTERALRRWSVKLLNDSSLNKEGMSGTQDD